jgi:hypothetical protein
MHHAPTMALHGSAAALSKIGGMRGYNIDVARHIAAPA